MPLNDLQMALGAMVVAQKSTTDSPARAQESPVGLRLTTQEHAWLEQVAGSPGFDVTCGIQRWWREMRLRIIVRLTLAALGPDRQEIFLRAYIDSVPFSSFFFIPEALGFLEYMIEHAEAQPHLFSVASFERAMLLASEATPAQPGSAKRPATLDGSFKVKQNPAASIVDFSAPPEELLYALISGEELPDPRDELFPVLIAPGLPHLWRELSLKEARLIKKCNTPIAVEALLCSVKGAKNALGELLCIGALRLEY
jgi:hypothetical protein